MTFTISQSSQARLQRYLTEYRPQLEKAIAAIRILETPNITENPL